MSFGVNKVKHSCRLCLSNIEKHKRYELFVKSELETDNNPDDAEECQENAFSKMTLYEKVEYCCGIRLAPKSQLPSKICGKCFYMIHMWFNFRQMSYNSQVILASETNIKLEDVSMEPIPSELQQMRTDLLKRKKAKEEFITPDPVINKNCHITASTSIEKEELNDTEIICDKDENSIVAKVNSAFTDQKNTLKNGGDAIEENLDNNSKLSEDDEVRKEHINDVTEKWKNCRKRESENVQECDLFEEICIEEGKNGVNENSFHTEERIYCNGTTEDIMEMCTQENEDEVQENAFTTSAMKYENHIAISENNGAVASFACNERNESENCGGDLDDPLFESWHVTDDNSSTNSKSKDCHTDDLNEQADMDEALNCLLAESGTEIKKIGRRRGVKERRTGKQKNKDMQLKFQEEGALRRTLFPPAKEMENLKAPNKYICNVCGNAHTNLTHFRRHMLTHNSEKQFVCEFCNKAFRTEAFLKKHMPVHTGEKRFKCKYCGIQYTDASSRHRHEKTHKGDRLYTCNICNKTFMYKSVLNRHVRLHSGDRNYSCDVCSMAFSLPHHLKAHIGTISHKEKQQSYEALGYTIVFERSEI